MTNLRSLLTSVEDLRVESVAQEPFCVELGLHTPEQTYDQATARGFDCLPIREVGGVIRRVVTRASLYGATNWSVLETAAHVLGADELVSRDAPVFSLLDRFLDRTVLFTLGRGGVDGVVTVYDLNQPAAHLLGFGFALICEDEVARVLREKLGDDPDHAVALAEQYLSDKRGINRWRKARREGKDVHVASMLMFGDKLKLLEHFGLQELANRRKIPPDDMSKLLDEIKDLRNAIGHYDTSNELADPEWVVDRMRKANDLVQWIFADGAHDPVLGASQL